MPATARNAIKKPYNIYLVCDDISQFDSKFIEDLNQTNCNIIPIRPEDCESIKKNRALKGVISVPDLSVGCGFKLLDSLREFLGRNIPLMVFAPLETNAV